MLLLNLQNSAKLNIEQLLLDVCVTRLEDVGDVDQLLGALPSGAAATD